ncbi:MAG: hypothetical protein JJE13_13415 [Thermoleophilia bacterium]|nr:hypothetical protein [Thermoleophilia bacterium]
MVPRDNPLGFAAAPLALAAILCAVYLVMAPLSADHAAQTFRTELFELSGPTLWNNYWFGGHYLPSYSLLAPPLGAWIGFRVMGVAAVLGTVALFALIARKEWGEQAQAGAVWFALAASISLFSGRLTFALGVLLAISAVYCAQRGWRLPSLVVAGAVGLASPVAALFLACCGFAHWLARRPNRRGLEIAVVTFVVAVAVALLFPGGGDEPYVWSSFYPAISLTLIAALMVPKEERLVRTGLLVYAAALVAAFALNTPMGGNANRLGVLLVGPLFLCAVWPRRNLAIVAFVPLFVAWQIFPVLRDLELVQDEPAVAAEFYEPVDETLAPRLALRPARVEVVPVASHWESARVAPEFPLARGWERQTDRNYNPLFYEDKLDSGRYYRWLKRLAVGYVAVPQTELDYAGETEAELISTNPPYLKEVPTSGDWRIYKVLDPTPMVQEPARLTALTTDGFTVTSPRAGTFTVRIRSTPYWTVRTGPGCVDSTENGWTEVFLRRPGSLRVEADFSPGARFGDRNCLR